MMSGPIQSHISILNAHARRGDVKGATKVLVMMKMDYDLGNIHAKPDVQTYTILINAWSKWGDQNAPIESERILKEMNNCYEIGALQKRPNGVTYKT